MTKAELIETVAGKHKELTKKQTGELIETLFARQGLGRTAVEAISHKDIPLVEGAILLLSLGYVLVNALVDTTYVLIDPRTRLGSRKGAP